MSDSGHQSPLGTNDLSSLLQNYGLGINAATSGYAGVSNDYEQYGFGQICQNTCLRLLTHAVNEAWRGNPDGKPSPTVYNNLIYIGAQTLSVAPTSITSEPGVFKVTFPLSITFPVGTILRFENVVPGQYNGSFPVSRSAPGIVYFDAPIDPGDATTLGLMYYNISVPALGNSIPISYVWEGAPYWGGSLYRYPNPVTQWAFCRLWALQASHEFNFNLGLPEYKDFLSSFNEAYSFIEQNNQVILSFSNGRYYLKGTFSNNDDLSSADVLGVNLAAAAFGQDIINLGNAIDFSYIDSFGLPSNLLKTLNKHDALTKSVTLALIASGLTTATLGDLLSGNISPTRAQEIQIYNAFKIIVGPELQAVKVPLGCSTTGLESLADLLNIQKIFPNSYQSMTVPVYNTVGLTPPRFAPTPTAGTTSAVLSAFSLIGSTLARETPSTTNTSVVLDPYGSNAWKLTASTGSTHGMYYIRQSTAVGEESWSILAKAGSASQVTVGFSTGSDLTTRFTSAVINLQTGAVLTPANSTPSNAYSDFYVNVSNKGGGWWQIKYTAQKSTSTTFNNFPFIYFTTSGDIYLADANIPGPTSTPVVIDATATSPTINVNWSNANIYNFPSDNFNYEPESSKRLVAGDKIVLVIPKGTSTLSVSAKKQYQYSRFAWVMRLDQPPTGDVTVSASEYQNWLSGNDSNPNKLGYSDDKLASIWNTLASGKSVYVVSSGIQTLKLFNYISANQSATVTGGVTDQNGLFASNTRNLYIQILGSGSEFNSVTGTPTVTDWNTPNLITFADPNIVGPTVYDWSVSIVKPTYTSPGPTNSSNSSTPVSYAPASDGYAPFEIAPPSKIYYPLYGAGAVPAYPPAQGGYGGFQPGTPAYKPYIQTFNPYAGSDASLPLNIPLTTVVSNTSSGTYYGGPNTTTPASTTVSNNKLASIWNTLASGKSVYVVSSGIQTLKLFNYISANQSATVTGGVTDQNGLFASNTRNLYIQILGSGSEFNSVTGTPTVTDWNTPNLITFADPNIVGPTVYDWSVSIVKPTYTSPGPTNSSNSSTPVSYAPASDGYAPFEIAPPSKIYYPLYGAGAVPAYPPAQGGYGGFQPGTPAYKPYIQTFNPYAGSDASLPLNIPLTTVVSNTSSGTYYGGPNTTTPASTTVSNNTTGSSTVSATVNSVAGVGNFVAGPGDGTYTPPPKDPNWNYEANNQFLNFANYQHDKEYFALEALNNNMWATGNIGQTGFAALPKETQNQIILEYCKTYNINTAGGIPTSWSDGALTVNIAPGFNQPPLSIDQWGAKYAQQQGWLDNQGKSTLPLDVYQKQEMDNYLAALPYIQQELARKLAGIQELRPGETIEDVKAAIAKFGVAQTAPSGTNVTTAPSTQNNTGVPTSTSITPVTIPAVPPTTSTSGAAPGSAPGSSPGMTPAPDGSSLDSLGDNYNWDRY